MSIYTAILYKLGFKVYDPAPPEGTTGDLFNDNTKTAANHVERLDGRIDQIELTPGPQGEAGPIGPTGAAGQDGLRGSIFLGSFATTNDLPGASGNAVRVGDYAYVTSTGELWRLD